MLADEQGFNTVGNALRPAVTNSLGALGGGVAGNAATDEDASTGERLRNIALGAAAGFAGAGLARGAANDLIRIGPGGKTAYAKDLIADALDLLTGGARAAFDLSGWRQMAPAGTAHPRKAAFAIKQELKSAFSDANFVQNEARINAQPWALRRAEVVPDWRRTMDAGVGQLATTREPTFILRAANRLGYRASNRGFVSLLNTMDDELFGMMVQNDGRPLNAIPDDVIKRYSERANTSTGRGPLPKNFGNEIAGARVFWAPSLFTSRVMLPVNAIQDMVRPGFNPNRFEMAKQLAAFVGVNTAILSTGKALGVWDVELDPRASDWGQGRIGNQRVDLWASFRPIVNLIARMATGEIKSTSGLRQKRRIEIVGDFLLGKLAPGSGTAVALYRGEDAIGQPFGWKDVVRNMIAPLFLDELWEAVTNGGGLANAAADPGAALKRGAIGALSGIGAGVGTYSGADAVAASGNFEVLTGEQRLQGIYSEGWRKQQEAMPELGQYETFSAWRDAERANERARAAAMDPAEARRIVAATKTKKALDELDPIIVAVARGGEGELLAGVEKSIGRNAVTKTFAKTRTDLENEWVKENPQLTLDLYDKFSKMSREEQQQHYDWSFTIAQRQLARDTLNGVTPTPTATPKPTSTPKAAPVGAR